MITQNTLFGRSSKSVGGIVAKTWKGINVVSSKPLTVANPKTPGQVSQRTKMANAVYTGRLLKSIIDFGFKERAVKMSQFNAFVSKNLKNEIFSQNSGAQILDNPTGLLISDGSIGSASILSASSLNQSTIKVITSAILPVGASLSDDVLMAVYDLNDGVFVQLAPVAQTRSQGTLGLSVISTDPNGFDGGDYVIYLGFFNKTTGKSDVSVSKIITI